MSAENPMTKVRAIVVGSLIEASQRVAAGMPAPPTPAPVPARSRRIQGRLLEAQADRIADKLERAVVRQQLRGDWPQYEKKAPTRGRNAASAQASAVTAEEVADGR